jgi:hypothetical protein
VEPELLEKLKRASSPLVAIYEMLETPWMRLYLTKRLVAEDPLYSEELKEKLGLGSVEELKEEYFRNKAAFGVPLV